MNTITYLLFEAEKFFCPLTQKIFRYPVLASDGYYYEEIAIMQYIKQSDKSPITGQKIDNHFMKCNVFATMLERYLNLYSDKRVEQYTISHVQYRNIVDDVIKNKKFDKLLMFTDFDLSFCNKESLVTLLSCDDVNAIKYFIDHTKRLDGPTADLNDNYLIHLVVKYSSLEILDHLVKKQINLEAVNDKLQHPIHIACKHGSLDKIKYLVNCGVDMESFDDYRRTPIHYVCRERNNEIIDYFLSLKVDITKRIEERYNGKSANYGIIELLLMNDQLSEKQKEYYVKQFEIANKMDSENVESLILLSNIGEICNELISDNSIKLDIKAKLLKALIQLKKNFIPMRDHSNLNPNPNPNNCDPSNSPKGCCDPSNSPKGCCDPSNSPLPDKQTEVEIIDNNDNVCTPTNLCTSSNLTKHGLNFDDFVKEYYNKFKLVDSETNDDEIMEEICDRWNQLEEK